MGTRKHVCDKVVTNSFRDLKKIIKRKRTGTSLKPPAVNKINLLTDEELFLDTMKEVQAIEEFREIPLYQKTIPLPLKKKSADKQVLEALEDIVKGRRRINLSDTQEYVEWVDQDYRSELIENLHNGQYSVQDCLDLHGIIVGEAEKAVEDFIGKSIRQGHRCIKIIHGRGLCSPKGPVLKDIVIQWLSGRYRKYVAAFVTARQCDGGLGALYVLLK